MIGDFKNIVHNRGLVNFKTPYHSKLCALLMTLLDYPLSKALVFVEIIFKIIMNLCDC